MNQREVEFREYWEFVFAWLSMVAPSLREDLRFSTVMRCYHADDAWKEATDA